MAFITSGNFGLLVNHSAFDQESTTLLACSFFFDNSMTSCFALNINRVLLSPSAAIAPTSSSSRCGRRSQPRLILHNGGDGRRGRRVAALALIWQAAIKLSATGVEYFRSAWNVFDFTIVMMSILDSLMDVVVQYLGLKPTVLRALRTLRIARILRMIKSAKGLRSLLTILVSAALLHRGRFRPLRRGRFRPLRRGQGRGSNPGAPSLSDSDGQ